MAGALTRWQLVKWNEPHRSRFGGLVAARSAWDDRGMTTQHSRISADPQRRGGRACVRDLRITVGDVLGWLAAGQTPEGILADYPELTLDDVRACLAYAAEREDREVRLRVAA